MTKLKDYGFRWAPMDRGDEYILNESSYTCLFGPNNSTSLRPDDVWLDIGANFGSFAIRSSTRVKEVIAVEPEPTNVNKLRQNIRLNERDNIEVIEAAVVGGQQTEVNLALGRTFNYTHRVGYIRGRQNLTVVAININDLVERFGVTKIKMDCEGSEDELLGAMNFEPIQEIIFEWHFTLIPDPMWSIMNEALEVLRTNGFEILRAPAGPPTKRWTAIIWARKS